jgi:hypothetical protein
MDEEEEEEEILWRVWENYQYLSVLIRSEILDHASHSIPGKKSFLVISRSRFSHFLANFNFHPSPHTLYSFLSPILGGHFDLH